jgi:hypothetical protein
MVSTRDFIEVEAEWETEDVAAAAKGFLVTDSLGSRRASVSQQSELTALATETAITLSSRFSAVTKAAEEVAADRFSLETTMASPL